MKFSPYLNSIRKTEAAMVSMMLLLTIAIGSTSMFTPFFSIDSATAEEVKTAVGATSGTLQVSGNGAATYSISIETPPGINGVQPNLSLDYTSQQDNGLLGMGWNLSELSAIVRCPQTLPIDGVVGGINFDDDDRFCMDGQRLMALDEGIYGADGTVYRTEIDASIEFVSHGVVGSGPAFFTATAKDGSTMEYGTGDAQIKAKEKESVRVWALKKTTDRNGNYVTVEYTDAKETGEYYPTTIKYTKNAKAETAQRQIDFAYEDRKDPITGYIAGSEVAMTKRLKAITTAVGEKKVKEYKLSYDEHPSATGRSLLQSIQECGSDTVCLPPTTFDYSVFINGFLVEDTEWGKKSNSIASDGASRTFADMNGDGLSDFFYQKKKSKKLRAILSTGSEFKADADWGERLYDVANDGASWTLADMNSDGLPDFVYQRKDKDTFWVKLNKKDKLGEDKEWGEKSHSVSNNGTSRAFLDMNGDGLTDFVYQQKNEGTFQVMLNTGEKFKPEADWGKKLHKIANEGMSWTFADMNGDGLPDYVYQKRGSNEFLVMLNTGSQLESETSWGEKSHSVSHDGKSRAFLDMNGDGLTDFVYQQKDQGTFQVMLNTGKKFKKEDDWGEKSNKIANEGKSWTFADMNGDDLPDYVYQKRDSNEFLVMLNTGSQLESETSWGEKKNSVNKGIYRAFEDMNGDGLPDFVYQKEDKDTFWVMLNNATEFPSSNNTANSISSIPDILTNITDGLNGQTTINYKPLTDKSVYAKEDTATGTEIDLQIPLYVVSENAESDGLNHTYNFRHHYAGAKSDRLLGWLGLRTNTVKNVQAGTEQTTTYHQDFPLIGLSKSMAEQRSIDGALLGASRSRHNSSKDESGVYTIYKERTEVDHYSSREVGSKSTLDYTLTTEFTYDDSKSKTIGIAQLVDNSVTADDLYSCYQYNNGSGDTWWRGYFPIAEKKFSAKVDCKYVNFNTWNDTIDLSFEQFAYDGNMNMVREQTWDDHNDKWIASSTAYDKFGNIINTTDPLGNTILTTYDETYHTFPVKSVSPPVNGLSWEEIDCAQQNNVCSFGGTRMVKYGKGTAWQYRLATNSVNCSNSIFGDPAPGVVKSCYLSATDPTTDSTALVVTSTFEPNFGIKIQSVDANGTATFNIPATGIDGFGRITSIESVNPTGKLEQVLQREFTAGSSAGMSVTTWQRETWGKDGNWNPLDKNAWMWETSVIDGMDRKYQTEIKGPDKSVTLKNELIFDSVGRTYQESLPYYSNETPQYITYTYDIHNRPYTITSPDGAVKTMIYDNVDDRKVTWKHPNPADKATQDTFVQNHANTDSNGRIASTQAPDGGMAFYEYDKLGRRTKVTDPLATNADGSPVTSYAQAKALEDSKKTVFSYNSLGQIMTADKPELGLSAYTYTDIGQLYTSLDAKGQQQEFTYDALGRIVHKKVYKSDKTLESETTYTYDQITGNTGKGELTQVSSPDISYTYTYNSTGSVQQDVVSLDTSGNGKPDKYTTQYTYDALGRAVDTTYPDTSLVRHSYNRQGYLYKAQLQDVGESAFSDVAIYTDYTSLGEARNINYINGVASTYDYDELGRMQQAQTAKGALKMRDLRYTWNKANKLLEIIDNNTDADGPSLTQSFSYNNMGRVQTAQAKETYGSLTYSYDFAGNLVEHDNRTYIYNPVKKHQLVKSCLKSTTAPDPECKKTADIAVKYDANGNATKKEFLKNNQKTLNYIYNAQNQLTQVQNYTGGMKKRTINEFTYDDSGRRIIKTGTKGVKTFYISPYYEIVQDKWGNKQHTRYIYGPNGVISASTKAGTTTLAAWENYNNVIASLVGINTGSLSGVLEYLGTRAMQAFAYPGIAKVFMQGLLLTIFLFLLLGIFVQIMRAAPAHSFLGGLRNGFIRELDQLGTLAPATVTVWSVPQKTQWMKKNKWWTRILPLLPVCMAVTFIIAGPATVSAAFQGNGLPVVGQTLYFHQDHLGSSVLVTNETGAQTNQVVYEPYGEIDKSSSTGKDTFRPKFTGKEFDANIDLSYFGARYYDGHLGRFITPDPGGQFFSPYVYGADDPLTHIDPDGEEAILASIVTILIVGAGGYSGGATANDSYNPASWKWSSGKTWSGISIGIAITAASFVAGAALAVSGIGGGVAIAAVIGSSLIEGVAWAGLEMGLNAGFDGVRYSANEVLASLAVIAVFSAAIAGVVPGGGRLLGKGVSHLTKGRFGQIANAASRNANKINSNKTMASTSKSSSNRPSKEPGCRTASFTKDTKVITAKGEKGIDDIKVGDEVWSYNEKTGKTELKPVSQLVTRIATDVTELTLGKGKIETTQEHPFYVPEEGWLKAKELEVGDKVLQRDGSLAVVTDMQLQEESVQVYNFEVQGNHNYFVGKEELLAHNCKGKNAKAAADNDHAKGRVWITVRDRTTNRTATDCSGYGGYCAEDNALYKLEDMTGRRYETQNQVEFSIAHQSLGPGKSRQLPPCIKCKENYGSSLSKQVNGPWANVAPLGYKALK